MDKFVNKILKNSRFLGSRVRQFSSEICTEKSHLVIKEAEKVVGSIQSLHIQNILKNDNELFKTYIQNTDFYINTEKAVFFNNAQPMRGLVVLLVSKMAAGAKNKDDRSDDIPESQRVMAKIAEMLKIGLLMHKNVNNNGKNDKEDHSRRNNLNLLLGDYLLSKCSKDVASLRNSEALEIVSSAIRDVCESQFFGLRNEEGRPLPSKPLPSSNNIDVPYDEFDLKLFKIQPFLGDMKAEWMVHNIAGNGSSLGKCLHASLLLANHEFGVQKLGYQLGRNISLAWQASLDRDALKESEFDLISAPVMFHLEYDSGFYKEIEKALSDSVDYNIIRETVMSGPGLDRTLQLEDEFREKSLKILEYFPDCDAKLALSNIIKAT